MKTFSLIQWHQAGVGAQLLSGRVLDSRQRGRGFKPHRHRCVVSLSKSIDPSLVLVHPRKTCPFITERLLNGRKETKKKNRRGCLCLVLFKMCNYCHYKMHRIYRKMTVNGHFSIYSIHDNVYKHPFLWFCMLRTTR